MSKSHPFSMYLLKESFNATNALKDEHSLASAVGAIKLPDKAVLFILDSLPKPPWWKEFWGISQELKQVSKGALLFLPVDERWFALCFGHTYHNLREDCYEYDFGIRVTLNTLDPDRLKSTDTLEPGTAKRQRVQSSIETGLTFFDFDRDSSMIKSLTGKVKPEYKDLFNDATGASNLRINSRIDSNEIVELCKKVLEVYKKDDYLRNFPNFQNIVPVKDPEVLQKLNEQLLVALHNKNKDLVLTIPQLLDYQEKHYIKFGGLGNDNIYEDVSMLHYHEYLENNCRLLNEIVIADIKLHKLCLCNEDGDIKNSFSIYKSILFDTKLGEDNLTYHLCEGNWYEVNNDFLTKIVDFLDPYFKNSRFIAYEHNGEGEYNIKFSETNPSYICLDKTSINPPGQTAVEPCDLYTVENNKAVYFHIKVSTRSFSLSHLFNQGMNSIHLIKQMWNPRTNLNY